MTVNAHRKPEQTVATTTNPQVAAAAGRTATSAVQLAVATTGFLLTFWAWALISPLGARYAERLGLSSFQQALLVAVGVVSALTLVPAPGWTARSARGFAARAWRTARRPVTRQLAFLYAVGFGGFVAFSVYLPSYLRNAYHLSQSDAAFRTAGFVVIAVLMRPIGGWLSDRLHPVPVLTACFATAAVLAIGAALELPLIPAGTIALLGLAAVLGASAGACFALVALLVPVEHVGATTGIVGAAGGLGGFFPPLVMGVVRSATGDYTAGYLLLAATAAVAAIFTWLRVRTEARAH